MARLGIENISVFGLPPVEFVNLAADLGCQHVSTGLTSFDFGVHDYPAFSLRDDAALRRYELAELKHARLAMIGLGGMVHQEILTKQATLEQLQNFTPLN